MQSDLQEFGSTEFKLLARSRIPTENSCIARDIVRVGDVLVLGYNVFVGLKKMFRSLMFSRFFGLQGRLSHQNLSRWR